MIAHGKGRREDYGGCKRDCAVQGRGVDSGGDFAGRRGGSGVWEFDVGGRHIMAKLRATILHLSLCFSVCPHNIHQFCCVNVSKTRVD